MIFDESDSIAFNQPKLNQPKLPAGMDTKYQQLQNISLKIF